jgi:hypothetical protein
MKKYTVNLLLLFIFGLLAGSCAKEHSANRLTIIHGKGSGYYQPGSVIVIEANQSETGLAFEQWIGDTALLDNPNLEVARCSMSWFDATLKATYSTVSCCDDEAVSFQRDVAPFIALRCQGCHGLEDPEPFSTHAEIASAAGAMLHAMETGFMPPGNPVPLADQQIFKEWIEQGKKNN